MLDNVDQLVYQVLLVYQECQESRVMKDLVVLLGQEVKREVVEKEDDQVKEVSQDNVDHQEIQELLALTAKMETEDNQEKTEFQGHQANLDHVEPQEAKVWLD